MLKCLSLPKSLCEIYSLHETEDPEGEEKALLKQLFNSGKALMAPSFFRLIQELKKNKREYSIVFRTFGTDIEVVKEEFNLLCRGEHPLFNGKHGTHRLHYDGKNNTKNMLLDSMNIGYLSEERLVLGTLNKHPAEVDAEEFHAGAIDEGLVSVYNDYLSIYGAIQERLDSSETMAIVDDCDAGKLLLIDDADYQTLQVFFGHEGPGALDVRDVGTGQLIPQQSASNQFYFKVDSYRAVTEPEYFYKALMLCEENRTQEIWRRETGGDEQLLVKELPETEWEMLQKLTASEYLSKTIFPVLLPGLKVVDMARPEDPVGFLALYLLKNQALARLPIVSYSVPVTS